MKNLIQVFAALLLSLSIYTPTIYSQGIKATFTPLPRNFPPFGNVVVGKSKDQMIRIHNDPASPGNLIYSLNSLANGSYTVTGPGAFSVAPGNTDTLIVHFAPTTLGTERDTLRITHNADTTQNLKNPAVYVLVGSGAQPDTFPKISITSSGGTGTFLNFGNVTVGKTATKTLVIKNTTIDTSRTLSGSVGLPFGSQYKVLSGGGAFTLDTGKSISVTIEFSPDTVAQFLVDSIIVLSNSAAPNDRVKITFFGGGVKASQYPKVVVGGIAGGTINFRTDTIGHSPKTATFTITNTSDSLRILSGSITSPGSPFAIVSGGGSFSLDSGKSQTIQLSFSPTKSGNYTDSIFITANTDPANPPIKIVLLGVGFESSGAHLNVGPAVLNFGVVKQGVAIAPLTIKLKNTADSPNDTLFGSSISPASPFSLKAGGGTFALVQGDSLMIVVDMSSAVAGNFSDSVVVISNSNDNAKRAVIRLVGTITPQTSVDDMAENIMAFSAMPNPLRRHTVIRFSMARSESVEMGIYDMLGNEVFSSGSQVFAIGPNEIEWNPTNLPDGTYFCSLRTAQGIRTLKLIVNK
ncbi:MAG: choice-of-anchor D domain-containing protein [Ignavibacteriota bacterium]